MNTELAEYIVLRDRNGGLRKLRLRSLASEVLLADGRSVEQVTGELEAGLSGMGADTEKELAALKDAVAAIQIPTTLPASDVYPWAKAPQKPGYTAAEVGAVPTSRKVNGKALSADITLSAADVGARPGSWTPTAAQVGAVPTSRKVNGKALSADITLSAADVGARPSSWTPTAAQLGACQVAAGVYVGNGSSATSGYGNDNPSCKQQISLGFTPKAVLVMRDIKYLDGVLFKGAMEEWTGYIALAVTGKPCEIGEYQSQGGWAFANALEIVEGGFVARNINGGALGASSDQKHAYLNQDGFTYRYVAIG